MKKVIVTGSVAFDLIMSMPGRFKDQIMPDKLHILNVSFMVDKLDKGFGGTGANQAYSLALLGIKPVLVAAVGSDFSEYKKHLKTVPVNIKGVKVFSKLLTASGFVVADKDDNQIWTFYAGAMQKARKLSLKPWLGNAVMVVIAPNDPVAMSRYVKECIKAKIEYMFDPAFLIPTLSKNDLITGVMGAKIIIGNDYEIALLLKKTGLDLKAILKDERILITTKGGKGSIVETGKTKLNIASAKPQSEIDPTGAGDAYRAGFLTGYLKGQPLGVCGRMGAVAAVYTVEKYGTQTHKFSLKEFKKRYKSNFNESLNI